MSDRRLIILLTILILAFCATSGPATAHHASWPIHKVWSKAKDRLWDPPPRPPDADCNSSDDVGKRMKIWDPILEEVITWVCQETDDGYGWRRMPWESTLFDYASSPMVVVYDWHRRCRSIVCKKYLRFHTRHWIVYFP